MGLAALAALHLELLEVVAVVDFMVEVMALAVRVLLV
jgi:hypothetical protein